MVRIPYVNKFEGLTDLPCKCQNLNFRLVLDLTWCYSLGISYDALLEH